MKIEKEINIGIFMNDCKRKLFHNILIWIVNDKIEGIIMHILLMQNYLADN